MILFIVLGILSCRKIEKNAVDREIDKVSAAIALHPDNHVAYNERGVVYFDNHNYDQAFADFSKAIELKPDFAEAP